MPKRKRLPASAVAYVMGFIPPRLLPGQPEPKIGRKALAGQYVRPYVRSVELGTGRVGKGAKQRYDRSHGTSGLLDFSAIINANQ